MLLNVNDNGKDGNLERLSSHFHFQVLRHDLTLTIAWRYRCNRHEIFKLSRQGHPDIMRMAAMMILDQQWNVLPLLNSSGARWLNVKSSWWIFVRLLLKVRVLDLSPSKNIPVDPSSFRRSLGGHTWKQESACHKSQLSKMLGIDL